MMVQTSITKKAWLRVYPILQHKRLSGLEYWSIDEENFNDIKNSDNRRRSLNMRTKNHWRTQWSRGYKQCIFGLLEIFKIKNDRTKKSIYVIAFFENIRASTIEIKNERNTNRGQKYFQKHSAKLLETSMGKMSEKSSKLQHRSFQSYLSLNKSVRSKLSFPD